MLIVFEGIDGSGKSTQAKMLHEYLLNKGVRAELTAEPTKDSEVGALLKKELRVGKPDQLYLQLLFTADRAWHVANVVRPALERGAVVITDRYLDSTRAYGGAAGLDGQWLARINGKFPKADLTLFMDVKPEEAMRRLAAARGTKELFDNIGFLTRVRSLYIEMSRADKGYRVIDASNDVDAVHKKVVSLVDKALPKASRSTAGRHP